MALYDPTLIEETRKVCHKHAGTTLYWWDDPMPGWWPLGKIKVAILNTGPGISDTFSVLYSSSIALCLLSLALKCFIAGGVPFVVLESILMGPRGCPVLCIFWMPNFRDSLQWVKLDIIQRDKE
ncbi:hypothetical protein CEXT_523251 [Caerostris extrusa]|uniref:Uncharacterized protein n=1 Tax=Caerostris extrusa TaxID=172846 RepID=A0AAV4RR58_CAEEX|nr:hypothetical protein CEXT_523251 [Caerostris extrusa]